MVNMVNEGVFGEVLTLPGAIVLWKLPAIIVLLNLKEGANDIFRISKARERRRRDLGDICFIKDEEGQTITDEEEIKKRWGEYFSSLFNMREREGHEEGVGTSRQPHPECYYSRISQAEVRTAWRSTGRDKEICIWLFYIWKRRMIAFHES
ncbi:hypothetical protein Tco_1498633 [Tanacetum coccineum]